MRKSVIVVGLMLSIAGAGTAEARGLRGGEVRLGVLTTLYRTTTTSVEDSDQETETSTIALGADTIGFQAGFALSRSLEIGGIISFADREVDDADSSETLLGLYLDYNIPVGVSSAYGEAFLLYQSSDAGTDISQQGIGIGGGFKAFLADGGSVDLGIKAFYLVGEVESVLGDTDIDTVGVLLHLGVSIWLGGGGGQP